ncbi:uncharacterized protein NPIL_58961 [Nephila pilipes]|uniref:Uncharacterized protein n=1 Tax=Nephila pilipes TaxID=299642 RepID=A0A8X6PUI4_NEPPI|nr:uncharacterized protein NPIL_58961 [Nephila pilipes]
MGKLSFGEKLPSAMDYLRSLALSMWCCVLLFAAAEGLNLADKNSNTFQNVFLNQWKHKNETLRRNPSHDIYIIKGPAGETQRIHYAVDDYGVRANIYTNRIQHRPDFDTNSIGFGLRKPSNEYNRDVPKIPPMHSQTQTPISTVDPKQQKFVFPEIPPFNYSKVIVAHPDNIKSVNQNRKNSGMERLSLKSLPRFSTKVTQRKSLTSNPPVVIKLTNSSNFAETYPITTTHQNYFKTNSVHGNIEPLRVTPINIFTGIAPKPRTNNGMENETHFETSTELSVNTYLNKNYSEDESNNLSQLVTIDIINNGSTYTVNTTSSDKVDKSESLHTSALETTSNNSTVSHLLKDFNYTGNISSSHSISDEPTNSINQSLLEVHINNSSDNAENNEEVSNNGSTNIEATTDTPQTLMNLTSNEINISNSNIQAENVFNFQNTTVERSEKDELIRHYTNNWKEPKLSSEILSPQAKATNQSIKLNETIDMLNNTLIITEIGNPDIENDETVFDPTEIRTIPERVFNSSLQVADNNRSYSVANDLTVNRHSSDFNVDNLKDVSSSNVTSFSGNAVVNINKTNKYNDIPSNSLIVIVKSDDSSEQSLKVGLDNDTAFVEKLKEDSIINPRYINQSIIVESTTESSDIEDRKTTEFLHTDKYDLNVKKNSKEFGPEMLENNGYQNIENYVADLGNKKELHSLQFNNTRKINNAFLKLWRGKSGVRIEPFGVNEAYKMIPVFQEEESGMILE